MIITSGNPASYFSMFGDYPTVLFFTRKWTLSLMKLRFNHFSIEEQRVIQQLNIHDS